MGTRNMYWNNEIEKIIIVYINLKKKKKIDTTKP